MLTESKNDCKHINICGVCGESFKKVADIQQHLKTHDHKTICKSASTTQTATCPMPNAALELPKVLRDVSADMSGAVQNHLERATIMTDRREGKLIGIA